MDEKIKGLLLLPEKEPEVIEFENSLDEMQRLVEGIIECVILDDDKGVMCICNDEAKLINMTPNRFVFDREALICGPMVIVGFDEEGATISLEDDLIKKYSKIFKDPVDVNDPLVQEMKEPEMYFITFDENNNKKITKIM